MRTGLSLVRNPLVAGFTGSSDANIRFADRCNLRRRVGFENCLALQRNQYLLHAAPH